MRKRTAADSVKEPAAKQARKKQGNTLNIGIERKINNSSQGYLTNFTHTFFLAPTNFITNVRLPINNKKLHPVPSIFTVFMMFAIIYLNHLNAIAQNVEVLLNLDKNVCLQNTHNKTFQLKSS